MEKVAVGGMSFSLDRVGLGEGLSLSAALAALSDDVDKPIVLVIDEAQQAIVSEKGNDALFALKAARCRIVSTAISMDTIHGRERFGHIGIGLHRAQALAATAGRAERGRGRRAGQLGGSGFPPRHLRPLHDALANCSPRLRADGSVASAAQQSNSLAINQYGRCLLRRPTLPHCDTTALRPALEMHIGHGLSR
ncbi:hypothetical protein [Cupriavidus basilensis]|uniref:hypothetical protein n=1 Tax=Cupriavidus basilensis TaxID=68895 RepID=UPI001F5104D5|nr:hypothetical protein [Cupriavidus basilensis]